MESDQNHARHMEAPLLVTWQGLRFGWSSVYL